jgi:hypothetical protein
LFLLMRYQWVDRCVAAHARTDENGGQGLMPIS